MSNLALWVTLEAKKGKEAEVETFLRDALTIVNNEHGTISWYALKLGPTSYGIFDTFSTNKEREAHLAGEVANKLTPAPARRAQRPRGIGPRRRRRHLRHAGRGAGGSSRRAAAAGAARRRAAG